MPTAKQAAAAKNAAMAKFEERFAKVFGEDSLVADEAEVPYKVISTGSIALDYALGVGGYVLGRVTEVWGQDDLGKSTLAMQGCREAQRAYPDRLVGWIDMERKWDWAWARTHGMDTSKARFRLYRPESAEDVADALKEMIRSGLFSMIVLDSIGAMIPEAEKEKDADEAVMMIQAKVITRMVKIAAVEADKTETAVVLLNQVRADTSMSRRTTTTGGGFALKHSSTHKIELKRGGDTPLSIKVDGVNQQVGHQIACFIERNKVAPAKKTAFITLVTTATEKYGPVGIDKADEAAVMGIKTGVIAQSGAYYTFVATGERVKTRDTVVAKLREDPELVDAVREGVLATLVDSIVIGQEAEIDVEALEVEEDGETVAMASKLEGTGVFRKGADKIKEATTSG
jgi:recombination protein RecA